MRSVSHPLVVRAPGDGRRSNTPQPFNELTNLLTVLRWGIVVVGIVLSLSRGTSSSANNICVGILVTYTLLRTFWPLKLGKSKTLLYGAIAFELFLAIGVVIATGTWNSPFVATLLFPVIAAGFAGGWIAGFGFAAVAAAIIGIDAGFDPDIPIRDTVNWTVEMFLVAALASYARRIFADAQQRASVAATRMKQLSQANALLHELNQVAQTLPASLDLQETLDSTAIHVKDIFGPDQITILLYDETTQTWTTAALRGTKERTMLRTNDLPTILLDAYNSGDTAANIADRSVFSPRSHAVLYAPLIAREVLIGFLVLESEQPNSFTNEDRELISGFAEQAALAIDNARWFDQLRFVGADQERTRIARELHDRVGQSLAYVGFELERLSKAAVNPDVKTALSQLRDDVRTATSEVRETLYDLRSEVNEKRSFVSLLEEFSRRVEARTGITVAIEAQEDERLALPQEREMWHIAQEAIVNAERHAKCKHITVTWHCSPLAAELTIHDDGVGFSPGKDGRADSFGLTGMHERAAVVGALLEIESTNGTTIRCRLERL